MINLQSLYRHRRRRCVHSAGDSRNMPIFCAFFFLFQITCVSCSFSQDEKTKKKKNTWTLKSDVKIEVPASVSLTLSVRVFGAFSFVLGWDEKLKKILHILWVLSVFGLNIIDRSGAHKHRLITRCDFFLLAFFFQRCDGPELVSGNTPFIRCICICTVAILHHFLLLKCCVFRSRVSACVCWGKIVRNR